MLPENSWETRSFEIKYLLNPSFSTLILHQAIKGYHTETKKSFPYPLAFLVLPIIFPNPIRKSLPQKVDASFVSWSHEYEINLIGLDKIVNFFSPYTKEAIVFGMQFNSINIHDGCLLAYDCLKEPIGLWGKGSSTLECYEKAEFLGRWFARTGATSIIFKSLGISL